MGSEYRSTVFASCFVQFVATLSMTFVNAFLTLFIYQDIGVSSLAEAAVWSGVSTFLASALLAVASPFWGWMTDRYGAKWMMVRVLASHSIFTALIGLSGNVQTVVLLRGIRGLTGGTSIVALTAIASTTEKGELPRALGLQHTAQLLGGMIGPVFGGLAAPIVGFRMCFFISGAAIATAIPVTLLLKWPEAQGKGAQRPSIKGLAGMRREFTAMFLTRATLAFLGPILPLYLRSAGIEEEQLATYTGAFLGITNLVLAVSIPITTRLTARRTMPLLLAVQSAAIMGQGLVISLPSLLVMRLGQTVLHSPVAPHLLSLTSEARSDKGVAIGLMSSAKFLGGAVSPVISSSASYFFGLTYAFAIVSGLSAAAAVAVWRLLKFQQGLPGDEAYEGYLPERESGS